MLSVHPMHNSQPNSGSSIAVHTAAALYRGVIKMSLQNAHRFLSDASRDDHLRDKFQTVSTPEEFLHTCQTLGYEFTTDELKDVIQEHSEGVEIRRKTGVWTWLRRVHWI
jgi:predicted ribosomally synthesized peptide with nif11-like leader